MNSGRWDISNLIDMLLNQQVHNKTPIKLMIHGRNLTIKAVDQENRTLGKLDLDDRDKDFLTVYIDAQLKMASVSSGEYEGTVAIDFVPLVSAVLKDPKL